MVSLFVIVDPVVFLGLRGGLGFLALLFGCRLLSLLLFLLLSCSSLRLLAFLALGLGGWLLLLRWCRFGLLLIELILIVVIILFTGAGTLSVTFIHQEEVSSLLLQAILH